MVACPPSLFRSRCSSHSPPALTGSVQQRKSPRPAQSLVANFPIGCWRPLDQKSEVSEHHAGYYQFGQDIGVSILCYLSWALWHLGYVCQATEAATEAMKRAENLSHPHTLVYTICHARGFMDLFRRRCEDTSSYAASLISTCHENGFSHW
jgi:hypothetical protein